MILPQQQPKEHDTHMVFLSLCRRVKVLIALYADKALEKTGSWEAAGPPCKLVQPLQQP